MTVKEFVDLLKLAINLNKHIMCYKNSTKTQFVIIIDGYACFYEVNY